MKNFFLVLKFELASFIKNKTFIISTLVICLILAIVVSIPTIKNTFFDSNKEKTDKQEIQDGLDLDMGDGRFGFLDETDGAVDKIRLMASFYGGELVEVDSIKKLKEEVKSGEFDAGFVLKSPTNYEYIVLNNEMMDFNNSYFEEALITSYRIGGFSNLGIDYKQVEEYIHPTIESETRALGKDSAKNYLYTYILVFGLYFIIMLYGQLIATSVASEKSNRAMEVLVTSTDTSYLIFGKVLSGALAGIIQFGAIILTGGLAYKLNAAAWDNALDFIFKIPGTVFLSFVVFGILGYLLFAFIYGALGALVSRTEDISTSATPITLIFIAVFMVSVFGMQNTEGIVLKIASFIPFSSFMAMFVRVSMGTVSNIEVIISLTLLVASTALIGFVASKIYRLGTLMYGNPIKIREAIRLLRSE